MERFGVPAGMMSRLQAYGRVLWRVTRASFTAAAFGSLALGVLPLLYLVRRRAARGRVGAQAREAAELAAQRCLHRTAALYMRILDRAGIVHLHAIDLAPLQRNGPHLIVANHPSLIDFVVMCSIMPQADCIVSPTRARSPVLRGLIRAAGHVRSDAGPTLVRECAERLARGRSLVVFPEGTRSPVGALGPFQRGAAHIALRVGCELRPLVIRCNPPALHKRWKWYDLPDHPIDVTVQLRDVIPSKPNGESGLSTSIAARRLTAELRESISKGLEEGAGDWEGPKHSKTS
jgi:1-acyl-sn-glycerol-3-phosphate acyltransferase